ncbi:hypothetical protein [Streptomyces sp. AgN23]|uniref:hypothetical protein n=1 Tax=Streptomyces sp. AgN23 TaxID=1188315 RepID=UPI001B31AECF|nr:hypothetical protein [Streptomyces sp. AgN23]QTI87209.1 hypothetical protein AS97_39600 [Streptomyces sp. AgN23]WTB02795.1 hypothetical protein OG546_00025 [Streptomyces antimycoticus]WTB11325.1 hypothetical protein OG546_49095 [Streptomyces antimycoticus]
MSTIALLLVLVLVLVGLMAVGGLAYAVYRRPVLTQPVVVALSGAMLLAALVTLAVTAGAR